MVSEGGGDGCWQLGDNEEDAFLLKGTRPLGVL